MEEEFSYKGTAPEEGDAPGLADIEWLTPTFSDDTTPQRDTALKDAAMSKYATTLQGATMSEDDIPLRPGRSLRAERTTDADLAMIRRWLEEPREARTSILSYRPWNQSPTSRDTAHPKVATMPEDGAIAKDDAVAIPRQTIASGLDKSRWAPTLGSERLQGQKYALSQYSSKNTAEGSQKTQSERSTRHGKDVAPSETKTYKPPMPLPPHLYKMLRLGPVGYHEIATKWNKGLSGDLVPNIVEALAGVFWTTLDVFRIVPRHSQEAKGPICLLIGVKPASTSSVDADRISLDCEKVLSQHGIHDVQCIVQEATVSQLVTQPTGEYQMPSHGQSNDPLSILGPEASGSQVQDSDGLGSGISVSGSASYGTKGMYLDVTDSEGKISKVALTCRHVPLPEESKFDSQLAFRHGLSSLPINELPISQMSVEQMECERSLTYLYHISKFDLLARQLRLSPRQMGHVAYAPPLDVAYTPPLDATSPTVGEWLADWAIVALDPTMHTRDLAKLSNYVSVHLTHDARDGVKKSFEADGLGSYVPERVLSLQGIIPEEEIRTCKDYKSLLVAKYGATTGLTYGISNNLMSLVHGEFGEREATVQEWAVIGIRDLDPEAIRSRIDFSAPGDSGSCVFDARNGRIGGQLHRGREWDFLPGDPGHVVGPVDVTYVTPIERLLEDIERRGFTVSLP